MDLYEFLKSLHVVTAVIWVGGAMTIHILAIRALASNEVGRIRTFLVDVELLGKRVFTPASVVVLVLGIWMVADAEAWAFGDAWIILGLIAIVASALTGSLFLGPQSGKIAQALTGPSVSDEARARMRTLLIVSRIELVVLFLIVVDMVVKPGT